MRIAAAIAILCILPLPALAWGGTGHRYIGELAAENFPDAIPAFLRTPEAAAQIGLLAQEPDISRNAGQPHDWDLDPGHFIDADDAGKILGGPPLDNLPTSRRDYDTALRAVNANEYAAGYLPYNIMDGFEQLVKDFALLRMGVAAEKYADRFAMTPAERARFTAARKLREMVTLRDLGVWAHFVGDASQPLHVTVHYNGWGKGANPDDYEVEPGLHNKFEAVFVDKNIGKADVAAAIRPFKPCATSLQVCVQDYLIDTQKGVLPVYRFEKSGAFDAATPQAKAFTVACIAQGASMLRDLVGDAWQTSSTFTLGYTVKESVADIEAGKADPRLLD